jgi:DNA-binding NarL/FixJ family response regulator
LQPINEQTIAIIREGQIKAYLKCLSGKQALSRIDRLALTARQLAVFELLVNGLSNREIAQQLGVQEKTVAKYVSAIFAKTGCHKRRQVIRWHLEPESSPPAVENLP